MERRDFLKNTILCTTGMAVFPYCGKIPAKKIPIGLQVYSVRDAIKEDVTGTFKKLSEIGYKNIEVFGYKDGKFWGKTPEETKKMIEDLGMTVKSGHTNLIDGFEEEKYKSIIEAHKKLGLEYIIQPWLNDDLRNTDGYKKLSEMLNKIGEFSKKIGIKTGYHNHAFEFDKLEADKTGYDIVLENTNSDLVTMELDLYWIVKGGYKPEEYFKKYPGRFELWHVKDMEKSDEKRFTEVGNGSIDFASIFAAKETAGLVYFFVEQDQCFNHKPLESIEISYNYLSKQTFL